jgi:hypothetical protein
VGKLLDAQFVGGVTNCIEEAEKFEARAARIRTMKR